MHATTQETNSVLENSDSVKEVTASEAMDLAPQTLGSASQASKRAPKLIDLEVETHVQVDQPQRPTENMNEAEVFSLKTTEILKVDFKLLLYFKSSV